MANVTDPLIASLSGSDPQNFMEYITRQKIYDSRFWKEECFGLSVADVLEKAVSLQCIGNLPAKFLGLTLKLLQLHPDTEMIQQAFIEQDEFKYVRALGCLYLRLTARPLDIYETLEPLYRDRRKLRVWSSNDQLWSIKYMDEWIHELLTDTRVVGIALPRLPARRVLQEAAYLAEGPRPTALQDVLLEHGGVMEYLKYKVKVEESPAAIALWETRQGEPLKQKKERVQDMDVDVDAEEGEVGVADKKERSGVDTDAKKKERRPKKKQRNYDNLFKKDKKKKATSPAAPASTAAPVEGSDEYWNAQRAALGLKPLNK